MPGKWAEFGQSLRRLREANYLSQRQLLKKVDDYCHVYGKATISRWENGWSRPAEAHLEALEEILGVKKGLLCKAARRPEYAEYRRMLAEQEMAHTLRKHVEPDKEQLQRDSKQEIDPIILKAQEEHLAEIRNLIEQWLEAMGWTPCSVEVIEGDSPFLADGLPEILAHVESNPLFRCLREHLRYEMLWKGYSDLKGSLIMYMKVYLRLKDEIRKQIGGWPGTVELGEDFAKPILSQIYEMHSDDDPHDLVLQTIYPQEAGLGLLVECVGSGMTTILEAEHPERYIQTYKALSTNLLRSEDAYRLVNLHDDIISTSSGIREILQDILLDRSYILHSCSLCPHQEQSKLDLAQKLKPQTYLEGQETRIHDKGIFEISDKILSEHDFENIFDFLSRNSCLKSQLIELLRFPEYFDSESNKYSDWRLNYLCLKLCQNLRELSFLIETDSVERDRIERNYHNYKEKSIDNEYSRLLKKLLGNAPEIDINSLERLDNLEREELYLVIDGNSHVLFYFPEISDRFHYEHYIEWQREFDKLVTHTRASYKDYRAAVRDTLFL